MASLLHQHGLYYLQFYREDRTPARKRVPLKVSVKRDAEVIRRKLERDYALGVFDPWVDDPFTYDRAIRRPETLEVAAAAFLKAKSHRAEGTQTSYRQIVTRFVAFTGPRVNVAAVRAPDVERWLDSTSAGDVTRHSYVRHLRAFFRWARKEGLTNVVATEEVRLRRVPQKFPRFLSPDEVDRLVAAIRESGATPWLADVVLFAVHTGLRRGELINLQWDAIDAATRMLTVANTETFTTKSGEERKVPLSDVAMAVLARRAEHGREGYVFTHSRGKINPNTLSLAFRERADEVGLTGIRFHHLRHTACSWLAMRGVPVEAIRRFAGHSSIAVTEKYMHLAEDVYADQIVRALAA